MTRADDDDNTTANTVFWANGVKRDIEPAKMLNGTKIFELAAAPDSAISSVKEIGELVWNTYLKRPEKKQ